MAGGTAIKAEFLIVMGVSGSGKTEVAQRLANACNGVWLDADDYHPPQNVENMRNGMPLNDEMRWPWLASLSAAAKQAALGIDTGSVTPKIFIACSALKRRYRDFLRDHMEPATFVFLDGSREVIRSRLDRRVGHFMPPGLLDSQLADLEPLGPDEISVTVSIDAPIEAVVSAIAARLAAGEIDSPSTKTHKTAGKPVTQGEDK
ncbi:gluconate kinase [Thalassospira lucentensis]|uniref:Gluconokinase n=2 Tax=Thalassospira TaxID=168934 RepID=A0A154L2T3_9PROT|nr:MULTISPECIES: gluconokinase [Thalassospira]MBO9507719.1 gluconokinase [Thalassospira sp. A3_1]KZB53998.1 gluconate kinase [Thalassospira xiamenensis]KZB62395.1 gluconate kinase [Thalassospira lucentensis]MCH2275168.1 gluconokinase [Thalassospira sp.]MCK2166677.1 gluconokinase [Thalassospira xiamenensis]